MKRVNKTAVVLIVFSSLFLGCKKYPEDPFISLREPWKRIAGTWQITSYQINGIEHSHDFDSLLSQLTLTDCLIRFEYGMGTYGEIYIEDNNGNRIYPGYGTYYINSDKTMSFSPNYNTSNTENEFYILVWKMTKNNSSTPPYYNIPNWNICELYGKHFHVNYEGTDIYFKKR